MARRVERLTAMAVAKRRTPGRYADGGGLYLQVGPTGGKSWLFRFTLRGRAREMGLGPVNAFSLADARARAARCRQLLADGIDPLAARDEAHAARVLEANSARTFDECAAAYIQSHRPGWKNPKHVEQWQNTLSTYCSPVFGALPVQSITTALVIKVLEPIWTTKNETASRLRGRIERVLDWAKARGYIAGDNPARWRGHLDKLLPAPRKVQKVSHHAALPYPQMGGFVRELRSQEGVAARALEFAILSAARTGEVIGAQWDELDFTAKVWTVPAERMKAKREHRVPLSDAALRAIRSVPREGEYVFCGPRPDRPLSNMAMLALLGRMKRDDLTVHGFRSSFRDWAAEVTNFPREVAEGALAHVLSDKTEAAYRRGDLFDKRRKLMQAWADWCDKVVPASVTPIKEARARRAERTAKRSQRA
jgi:integrase